ncbi:MAG: coproporphyrinogen-III oxidase family protein, partial [bacterium]
CILQAYDTARRCGFDQINLDLIFAIPDQTLLEWRTDLQIAFSLAPEHLSLYSLSIEPKTEFGRLFQSELLDPIEPDLAADMFELAIDLTASEGYQQYEISNYCREGRESRHNLRYWRNERCLGFGLGAASYDSGRRWTNTSDWDSYQQIASGGSVPRDVDEQLAAPYAMAEEIMLRLRTRWGFSPESLSKKYDCDFWSLMCEKVDFFQADGLLETSRDHICLTRKGLLLADEICAGFLRSAAPAEST